MLAFSCINLTVDIYVNDKLVRGVHVNDVFQKELLKTRKIKKSVKYNGDKAIRGMINSILIFRRTDFLLCFQYPSLLETGFHFLSAHG